MQTLKLKDQGLQRGSDGEADGLRHIVKMSPEDLKSKQTTQGKMEGSSSCARQSRNDRDSIGLIAIWQEDVSSELGPGQTGVVVQLVQGCLDIFSSLVRSPSYSTTFSKNITNALNRSLATLQLWADGHSVMNGQLDRILERSKSLQYTTLATMNALCGVLVNSKSSIIPAKY